MSALKANGARADQGHVRTRKPFENVVVAIVMVALLASIAACVAIALHLGAPTQHWADQPVPPQRPAAPSYTP